MLSVIDANCDTYIDPNRHLLYGGYNDPTGDRFEGLPDAVMADACQFFVEETSHRPAKQFLDALSEIPRFVMRSLQGKIDKQFGVSSIPPGGGKTVSTGVTIKHVRQRDPSLGVVVLQKRYTQITDMIENMKRLGISEADYAVYVTAQREEGAWGLGRDHINEAGILFTTHAMFEKQCLGRQSWADAEEFHFLGKPRRLLIRDEGILPGVPIILPKQSILLPAALRIEPPALRNEIEGFAFSVAQAADKQLVTVPEFADNYDLNDALGSLSKDARRLASKGLDDLWRLSGRQARVIRDGYNGNTLIQYEAYIPTDTPPMLVLDASAQVRATYKLQKKYADSVEFLRNAAKRYDDVTFRIREAGSGKRTFGKRYEKDLEEIATVLLKHPHLKPLILHHKADKNAGIGDVETDLSRVLARLPLAQEANGTPAPDVAYCSWGRHDGTNVYKDRDLLMVASTLHIPNSVVETVAYISAGLPIEADIDANDVSDVRLGEALSDLLQGLSRGSMRNLNGVQAQKCLVYITLPKNSPIKRALPELFPGAKILNGWGDNARPLEKGNAKLSDQQRKALIFIGTAFQRGAEAVSYKEIYEALGMQPSNFSAHVINSPYMQAKLTDLGYESQKVGRSKFIVRKDH